MKDYDEQDRYDEDEILDGEETDAAYSDYDEIIDGEYDADYDRTDEKFDKVLDEIAGLRRDMDRDGRTGDGRSRASQSEAGLYDEINRLRGELAETRRAQSMQAELSKMREQIDREAEEKNARLVSEIEYLKSRIPASAQESAQPSSEETPAADGMSLKGIESELAQLRSAMSALPSMSDIAAKLGSIPNAVSVAASASDACASADTTEVMRRLIDIRLAIGRMDRREYENDLKLLSVYNALTVAKSTVYTASSSLSDKLDAMRRLDSEIMQAEDCYIGDVADKYNEMVAHILSCPVRREDLTVAAGLGRSDKIKSLLTPEGRTAAVKFLALAGAVKSAENINAAVDKLPELVNLKNTLQSNREKAANDKLCSEILALNSNLVFMMDAAEAEKCASEIREKADKLCSLSVGEIIYVPGIVYDKAPCTLPVHSYVREAAESAVAAGADQGEAVSALTDAVNMLRAEISGGAPSSVTEEMTELQRRIAAAQDGNREAILSALEDLGAKLETRGSAETQPAAAAPDEVNLLLSEIVSLRDELQSYKDEVSDMADNMSGGTAVSENSVAADGEAEISAVMDELASVRAELGRYAEDIADIREAVGGKSGEASASAATDDVIAGISEIRKSVEACGTGEQLLAVRDELLGEIDKAVQAAKASPVSDDIIAGIEELKAQISDLRYSSSSSAAESAPSEGNVLDEITSLRADIAAQPTSGDIADIKAEISALRGETESIKSGLARFTVAAATDNPAGGELAAIRAALETLCGLPDAIAGLRAEVAAMRAEINELRTASVSAATTSVPERASAAGVRTDELVEKIYGDVRTMVEEPDYSVMNEILALREEYQNLKESINRALGDGKGSGTDKLLEEIESLRDQIFTINMASVSDGENQTYESYNNLIVDSLGELRDEVRALSGGTAEEREPVSDPRVGRELGEIKDTQRSIASLLNQTLGELQKLEGLVKSRRDDSAPSVDNEKDDKAELRSEIENLKYTVGVMQGKEEGEDADLEGSIARLKKELSEVAGILGADGAGGQTGGGKKKK